MTDLIADAVAILSITAMDLIAGLVEVLCITVMDPTVDVVGIQSTIVTALTVG